MTGESRKRRRSRHRLNYVGIGNHDASNRPRLLRSSGFTMRPGQENPNSQEFLGTQQHRARGSFSSDLIPSMDTAAAPFSAGLEARRENGLEGEHTNRHSEHRAPSTARYLEDALDTHEKHAEEDNLEARRHATHNAHSTPSIPGSCEVEVQLLASVPNNNAVEVQLNSATYSAFSTPSMACDDTVTISIHSATHNASSTPSVPHEDTMVSAHVESSESILYISNWRVLLGLLLTNGSLKVAKSQYQVLRMVAETFRSLSQHNWRGVTPDAGDFANDKLHPGKIETLPHYTTLFRKFKPSLYGTLVVRGKETLESLRLRQAGARPKLHSDENDPLVPVRTILPSEYARADIGCAPVFELMRSTSLAEASSQEDCLDKWPVVSARAWFYGPGARISVDDSSKVAEHQPFAESGEIVSVEVMGCSELKMEIFENFVLPRGNLHCTKVQGEIIHIWTVHSERRKGDASFTSSVPENLYSRDKEIVSAFSFSSYKSPSDVVNVLIPEIPPGVMESAMEAVEDDFEITPAPRKRHASPQMAAAIRERNSAIRERRRQTEQAWMGWTKPALKPGDVVALIKPVSPQNVAAFGPNSTQSRICLVQTFWTEKEERSRHILWIPSYKDTSNNLNRESSISTQDPTQWCSPLGVADESIHRDVRHVQLDSSPFQSRGPEKILPVSSYGTLDSGERYFIYRFLLFWDGFEITSGKSATGEGVYMACLNLPPKSRSSPNSVRVISLTPPGVKQDVIFKNIQEDIVKGMSDGFLDHDASGNMIRIFLDLVGFIGDTPAINSTLDVLGHTGVACCHLCRFTRCSKTVVGSRYTHGAVRGLYNYGARGFYQHCGVQDSEAKVETCRLLGITPLSPQKSFPLHDLRSSMLAAVPLIPTVAGGVPILSGCLDPYLSCFVEPDHLLTGHFRDCMNVAFRLLPNKEYRKSVEEFLIGLLADAKLPVQNRLFDIEKKTLFSMSMTELYSLSLVAQFGFGRGCTATSNTSSRVSLSPKCLDAISVLASCAALIARLWNSDYAYGSKSALARYLLCVQRQTAAHIARIERLCSMSDSNVEELQNNGTRRLRRVELEKERRECIIAIKTVDKPNVHRLFELVHSTLPMIGHLCRIGELVFEKAHQVLKRAIKQSNNKDIQIQSVLSAAFSDWQGRLTMVVPGVLRNDSDAIRGCLRLFAGREAVARIKGHIDENIKQQVLQAFGPDCCIPSLLREQGKSVVSKTGRSTDSISWSLEENKHAATLDTPISSDMRVLASREFMNLWKSVGRVPQMEFGDMVRSVFSNGLPSISIHCGDVIGIHCDGNLSNQFPIVAQTYFLPQYALSEVQDQIMFWAVAALFKVTSDAGCRGFWAAVFPCQPYNDNCVSTYVQPTLTKYCISKRISFLQMERSIRVSAVIPACSSNLCIPSDSRCCLLHAPSCHPFSGTPFFILSKTEGFPPRKG